MLSPRYAACGHASATKTARGDSLYSLLTCDPKPMRHAIIRMANSPVSYRVILTPYFKEYIEALQRFLLVFHNLGPL